MRKLTFIAAGAMAAGLILGACGGSKDKPVNLISDAPDTIVSTTAKPTTTTTTAPPTTTTTAPPPTTTTTAPPATAPPTTAAYVPPPAYVPPAPAPAPAPSASYANCTEARAAGVTPLYRGQPGYAPKLDRDNDGVACE